MSPPRTIVLLLLLLVLPACAPARDPGGGPPSPPGDDDDDDASAPDDDDDDDDDDVTDPGDWPFGTPGCEEDEQCATLVCWDFADYDSWCGGTICSDRCETEEDCIEAAAAAGAPAPEAAYCGEDFLCDLVGTGLGEFWCADGDGATPPRLRQ